MDELKVPVGISNRHLHLSESDLHALFGESACLTEKKPLSQKGQYACEELVTVVGPKGTLNNVRVLGPTRKQTQVEVSNTDARVLGGSVKVMLIGPKGEFSLPEG